MAEFVSTWTANRLSAAPMIAPARQFIFPRPVPGEEDAMARGAMWLDVKPREGGSFLAQCALGFQTGSIANGVFATPNPDELCAVAGGYAYLIDTLHPEDATQVPLRPVVSVMPVPEAASLVFVGFHHLYIRGVGDVAWQTSRLSWEGITLTGFSDGLLHGRGWEMQSDTEIPFTVNLETRACLGGGFRG